jgi:cell division protein FtsI (penicillin-binding protein 3)
VDLRAEELALKRLRIFARVCLVWGLLIAGRLFQLQILNHDEYSRQAQQQQQRQVELRAPRGAILDRNGQPLAMSVAVDSVCINPLRVPDVSTAAMLLSRVLDLDAMELFGKITSAVDSRRGFMWVKRKISTEEAERLRSYNLDWVEFRTESSRYYPKGSLGAHILGGVDYEEKGNGGVEQYFEKDLRGTPGVMRTTADVRQNVFDLQVFSDPEPGSKLTLSIDERIQYVAEQELAKAVKEHEASTGSLVAMDPQTGDILAIANYPSYDPNESPKTKHDIEARKNLAITAPFEPGSVFKVITLSTALESTRLTPESLFFCNNGAFTLFRRVIHDAHGYGTLTMAQVLAKSSNIGAIKIALVAGNENLYKYVKAFGFGSRTGIPLPGESGGIVRKLERWIPSSIGSVAMGHEISTTTVQLARACSVIANGGFLAKPRLVLRTEGSGEGVTETRPELTRLMKPENAMKMRMMMKGVVDFGTGRNARLKGYSSAGKTGSAQIYDYHARVYTHRYNGSFMGFAPVNNPRVVIVVTLNNTPSGTRGYGGTVSAPVFSKVMTAALRFLDVPKDLPEDIDPANEKVEPESDLADSDISMPPDPEGEETASLLQAADVVIGPEEPPSPLATGPKVPDFLGKTKREVLNESSELGMRVQVAGKGVARFQQPRAGSILEPGERVKVVFTR